MASHRCSAGQETAGVAIYKEKCLRWGTSTVKGSASGFQGLLDEGASLCRVTRHVTGHSSRFERISFRSRNLEKCNKV